CASSNVIEQCPHSCRHRRRCNFSAHRLRGRKATRQQPDSRAFDVTLAASHLSRKAQAGLCFEAQRWVKQLGTIDKGIAMNAAKPRELRILKAPDHAEDACLL